MLSDFRQPVAWRYKLFESDLEWTVTTKKPKGVVVEPLFTHPSEQAVTEADKSDDAVAELFFAAWAEADKAMRKFPQPNYVISKVAEEAGEVVKAAIHCAEGRETSENVVAEIKQAMAMLIRLYVEGDQVHGLPALKAAMEAGRQARVRAENDAFQDAVVTGLGAVKMNADGSTERVDLRAEPHPDDEAVDRFAAAMKAKLKWEREERGRYGWNDPEVCSEEYLAKSLVEHLTKGNEGNFEDIANFCMMLHQRAAHPRVLAAAFRAYGEKWLKSAL